MPIRRIWLFYDPMVLETDPIRRLYLEELSRKTVLVGRWSTPIGALILAFFVFCDSVLVPVHSSLPWRFLGIACCLGFLALAHTRLKHDARLAIPLYAATLGGVLLSVCGVACTAFYFPPLVPGAKYGAVAGVIATVLALFVFASGARRYLPYIIGVPLALMVLCLTLGGVLAPNEWIHITNPVVAGIAVVAMALIQEPIFYNEFNMRHMALENNVKLMEAQEILKQAHDEELQRHRAELAHVARLSMMGEMVATLAHELNQPLHAINSYACGSVRRLLRAHEQDKELVVALEQIGEETNRAAEIIRRVRGFVQKRKPQVSKVFVNDLVREVILLSKVEIEQHRAKAVLALAEGLATVTGDPIQIQQVLMNLVRNALEAMEQTPADNRLLDIKTMRHGDVAVEVEVCDRGKGIDTGDLDKVFEPFFTTKPEGMGMGLAISRSIIQTYEGRLWVSANQHQGCTFHFTLPVNKGS
jgi:signal transduction histidine kinase